MRKNIIIEESNNPKIKNRNGFFNKLLEWFIYIIGYALILIIVSCIFKNSFYINNKYFGLYALIASIIIYILNQTIKPVLVYLTLPITALTYGLFYPIVNVIILYMASFFLGDNFRLHGFFIPFVIAILVSFFNLVLDYSIIRPIINKRR